MATSGPLHTLQKDCDKNLRLPLGEYTESASTKMQGFRQVECDAAPLNADQCSELIDLIGVSGYALLSQSAHALKELQ